MIQVKSGLSKKEESEVRSIICDLKDSYSDFYITHNNLRLMISDNFDVLCEGLKKGDKIAFDEHGVILVVGYSDNAPRKYLKILTKDLKSVEPLLKALFWNVKEKELYLKLKNSNPLKDFLLSKPSVYLFEGKNCFADGTYRNENSKYLKLASFDKQKARLLYSGFEFVGGRGKETLLRYVAVESSESTPKYFAKDKDE